MDDPKQHVHSRIIKTVGDLLGAIDEFSTLGMLTPKHTLRSYEKCGMGIELMWSVAGQQWYVAELTEEAVS